MSDDKQLLFQGGSGESADCLACFSLRLPGKSVDYEIRHYHDLDRGKYLRVVQYRKGKFFHERSVDLSLVDPEFLELRPETPRRLPLVLAWSWVALASAMLLAVVLLAKNGDALSLIPGGFWVLATDLYCFNYIFKNTVRKELSSFWFQDNDVGILIPYKDRHREESLRIAREIAGYCSGGRVSEPDRLPVLVQQFGNGKAELRDRVLLLYNESGIPQCRWNLAEMRSEYCYCVEHHFWRNFFCKLIAWGCWLGTLLGLILVALMSFCEPIVVSAFAFMGILPAVLGLFVYKKCLRSYEFYFFPELHEEFEGIYLECGKDAPGEKLFVGELRKRLQALHEKQLSGSSGK